MNDRNGGTGLLGRQCCRNDIDLETDQVRCEFRQPFEPIVRIAVHVFPFDPSQLRQRSCKNLACQIGHIAAPDVCDGVSGWPLAGDVPPQYGPRFRASLSRLEVPLLEHHLAPLLAGLLAATQRPPGLYTERPWRRTAGLDPGSVRRLDNEQGRVAFHGAD